MGSRLEATFDCDPASVHAAREFVVAAVSASDLHDQAEVAALCTSEVATNAVRHARNGVFRVIVHARGAEVVVEVEDRGDGEPAAVVPDRNADSGRGLRIVAALADRWGWHKAGQRGKVVWFSLSG